MRLRIEICLDGAACTDDPNEVGRLLEDVALSLPWPLRPTPEMWVVDQNGNRVGTAQIDEGDLS